MTPNNRPTYLQKLGKNHEPQLTQKRSRNTRTYNLHKASPILVPIRLIDTINFKNKIKSQAAGPSGITPNIIKHTPIKTALLNASSRCGALPFATKKDFINPYLISTHCFTVPFLKFFRENYSLQTKKSYGREAD